LTAAVVRAQMERQLESMVATSGAVFYDRGEQRTTRPCEHAKLHSALLIALQQRRVHPLKPTLQPMRCPSPQTPLHPRQQHHSKTHAATKAQAQHECCPRQHGIWWWGVLSAVPSWGVCSGWVDDFLKWLLTWLLAPGGASHRLSWN